MITSFSVEKGIGVSEIFFKMPFPSRIENYYFLFVSGFSSSADFYESGEKGSFIYSDLKI